MIGQSSGDDQTKMSKETGKRSGKEQSGVVYLHHVQHAHRNREWQTELVMEGQTELTTWLPLPDVRSALGMPQEAIRAHRGLHQL